MSSYVQSTRKLCSKLGGKPQVVVTNPHQKQKKKKLVVFLQKAIPRRGTVFIFSATAQIDHKRLRNNFTT